MADRARLPFIERRPLAREEDLIRGEPDVGYRGVAPPPPRVIDPKPAALPPSEADTATLALGQADRALSMLEDLARLVRAPFDFGAVGDPELLSWTAAEGYADYRASGTFKSVAVVNLNDSNLYVGLVSTSGRGGGQEVLTLPPRAFILLPIRATELSVGTGTTAGSAAVIPFTVPMPFQAGSLAGAGTAAGSPQYVSPATGATFDVSDRLVRALGRVSIGLAESLSAAGEATAPAAAAAIATLAAPPAGTYDVQVGTWISAAAAADATNLELRRAGVALFSPILVVSGAARRVYRLTLDGAQNLSVNAIGAGGAGVIYVAEIIATRVE